jgi:hypothetical protein
MTEQIGVALPGQASLREGQLVDRRGGDRRDAARLRVADAAQIASYAA